MFELEDYTGSFHDGFINKYADSSGPTLDFYISDSLQDMLDVDIRTEIANVVKSGGGGEYGACIEGLQSTFDQATDGTIMQNYSAGGSISSSNNNNNNNNAKEIVSDSFSSSSNNNNNNNSIYLATSSPSSYGITASTNSSSFWFGSSNDFFADVGACVNPISVMPLISSSLSHHLSSRVNLNRHNSPPPASPSVNDTKSHLTFSPAHIKVSANSIRNEQLTSHIPKQIVAISSALTSATTVPATLATNSLLQRKMVTSNGVESVKKDLGCKLSAMPSLESKSYSTKSLLCTAANAQQVNSSKSAASTIKLGPGIGSLTFAHNITFSKIKQQAYAKSPLSSPILSSGAGNNGIIMNRDRDRSPSQNRGGAANVPKLVTRHTISSPALGFTPKSIASAAHSILQAQQQSLAAAEGITADRTLADINGLNNPTSNNNIPTTSITTNLISSTSPHGSAGGSFGGGLTVKSLQQKIKSAHIESEYPKPAYSYSCLIAMALKNSRRGSLPVSEIYSFMCEHFPYFKTAPSGWKNSVRHNLSLNKCFEKIEKPPTNGYQRKGCLWAMNPERITKMDEEVQKWSRKDPMAIRNAMVYPEHLEALERGEMKHGSTGDSDAELDSQSEIEETSDLEEQDMDETLVEPMLVEDDFDDDEASLLTGGSSGLGGSSSSSNGGGGAGPGAVNSIMLMNSNEGAEGKSFVARNDSHSLADTDSILTTTPTRAAASHNFDNEVEDIYDAIDIEDDKDAVRVTINHMDIIELNPADYNNVVVASDENHQSPKRARLNLNCSTIDVSNELEKRFIKQQQQQQQIQISTVKKIVKINQNVNDLQQQQQQQSLIVKQSVEASTDVVNNTMTSLAPQHQQQFTSVVGLSNITNRRKIQIANRLP